MQASNLGLRETAVATIVATAQVVVAPVTLAVPHLTQRNLLSSSSCHLVRSLAGREGSPIGSIQGPRVVLRDLPAGPLLLVDTVGLALSIWIYCLECWEPPGRNLFLLSFCITL